MDEMPFGVVVVAILVLLGAVGDFFLVAIWVGLGAMGGPIGVSHTPPVSYWIVTWVSLLLSAMALVASIGLMRQARFAWYLSIALWILSAAHHSYVATLLLYSRYANIAAILAILINATFIAYFQLKRVRNCFLKRRSS